MENHYFWKTAYKWQFSMAKLNYQRVFLFQTLDFFSWLPHVIRNALGSCQLPWTCSAVVLPSNVLVRLLSYRPIYHKTVHLMHTFAATSASWKIATISCSKIINISTYRYLYDKYPEIQTVCEFLKVYLLVNKIAMGNSTIYTWCIMIYPLNMVIFHSLYVCHKVKSNKLPWSHHFLMVFL